MSQLRVQRTCLRLEQEGGGSEDPEPGGTRPLLSPTARRQEVPAPSVPDGVYILVLAGPGGHVRGPATKGPCLPEPERSLSSRWLEVR